MYIIPVTRVNQDHLHSLIQDITETSPSIDFIKLFTVVGFFSMLAELLLELLKLLTTIIIIFTLGAFPLCLGHPKADRRKDNATERLHVHLQHIPYRYLYLCLYVLIWKFKPALPSCFCLIPQKLRGSVMSRT